MKAGRMKIPPLSQLYEQKHDYEVHRKKLLKIKSHRKSQLLPDGFKDANQRRNVNNYQRRFNSKSLEIARENSNLVTKIQKVKPNICFRYAQPAKRTIQSLSSHSLNSRSKILEQQKQNYRMRSRVKSMNSSLNRENLLKDYNRSVQIKNRLVHFKTEENNKVTLKANSYLNKSSYLSSSKVSSQNKLLDKVSSLPKVAELRNVNKQIMSAQKINKEMINMRLNRVGHNIANYYKKDEILKNKVISHNKLFAVARERRSQVMTTLEKRKELHQCEQCNEEEANIFPTELSKQVK